jgi:hypothetical protein
MHARVVLTDSAAIHAGFASVHGPDRTARCVSLDKAAPPAVAWVEMNEHHACDRRDFLATITAAAARRYVPASPIHGALPPPPLGTPTEVATRSDYWAAVAAQYDVDRTVTNLENAYFGIMARPVETAYVDQCAS